jgi:ferredoxin-type protein NapH
MSQKRQKIRKGFILISFLLFPIILNYLSPYLIIMGSAAGIITGSFIVFAVLLFSSLFFGRAFCGWLCPAAGLQEACFAVRDKRVKGGNWIKFLIWVPWVALIVFMAIQAKGYHVVNPFYQTDYGISVSKPQNYFVFYTVIALVVTLAFTVGRRSFCHHVCWMAPFMMIGTKIKEILGYPSLHLQSEVAKCTRCKLCTKKCPMSLEVAEMVQRKTMGNAECILCGECVDACPKGVIKFGVKRD